MVSRSSSPVRRGLTRLAVLALAVALAPSAGVGGPAQAEGGPGSGDVRPVASAVAATPVAGSAAGSAVGDGSAKPDMRLGRRSVPPVAAGQRVQARGTAAEPALVAELARTTTKPFGLVGVTWATGFDDEQLRVEVSSHVDGSWTAWEPLDIHADEVPDAQETRAGTSPVWVGEADGVGVRVYSANGRAPEDVEVALIDGGTGLAEEAPATDVAAPMARMAGDTTVPAVVTAPSSTEQATTEPSTEPSGTTYPTTGDPAITDPTVTDPTVTDPTVTDPVASTTGVAPRPRIVTRAEWGVDTSTEISCSKPRYADAPKGIVLHHTAGSNDYTAEEAPGIVRGIHSYHTAYRGWCDLGYNFLVDKYGTIYEGRRGGITEQVRGAHAGNWEVNLYTTGISMMGNFDEVGLTKRLKGAVTRLAAWRLSYFGLGAIGKITFDGHRIPKVSGHRDVYRVGIRPATSTACPGKYAYYWLNHTGLRKRIQRRINNAATTETPPPPPEPTTSRMGGVDRYATAAAISRESFDTADTVFLASGESFPDALSAGSAAARQDAPTLLVRSDSLPDATATELARLQPAHIYLLGGAAAISDEVAAAAGQYGTVTRLAGGNRYATGTSVTSRFWNSAGVVYLASGDDYPDALSGGALAAHNDAPILLSRQDKLPRAVRRELTALNPTSVVLLGGLGALDDQVATEIGALLPAATVTRLAGADRYETSAVIAKDGWETSQAAYFASGEDFPDALSGVPAAGSADAPLLLTRPDCMPSPVYDEAAVLSPMSKVLLGGTAVLSESVLESECTIA